MDHKLRFLDSFVARGTDGASYKIKAYEHVVRDEAWLLDGHEHWEPTGQLEYRLDDDSRIDMLSDGSLRIARTDVALR